MLDNFYPKIVPCMK